MTNLSSVSGFVSLLIFFYVVSFCINNVSFYSVGLLKLSSAVISVGKSTQDVFDQYCLTQQ